MSCNNTIDKLDFIKIDNFCASKDVIKKVKRSTIEWETIFANHRSDKGLGSEYIKSSYSSTTKRQTVQLKNRQTAWTDIFFPKKTGMAKKQIRDAQHHCHSGKANPNDNETPPHTHEGDCN